MCALSLLIAPACGGVVEGSGGTGGTGGVQPQILTYCNNPEAGTPTCEIPGFDIRAEMIGCAGDPVAGGCHSGAEPQLGFEIDTTAPGSSPADWVREYVNAPATVCGADRLIDAADPDCSFMLTKVTDKPKCGSRMPFNAEDHFTDQEADCFRKWVHDAFAANAACSPFGGDGDGDGVCDEMDVCPGFDDAVDTDMDGTADGCDECLGNDVTGDTDNDDVCDDMDVCAGDDASGDTDSDTICDDLDECPGFDDAVDTDTDGIADGCDACPGFDDSADDDTDGVPDGCDQCPGSDDTVDSDMDGVPDGCDACAGFDDNIDMNMNGTPDGCDV